MVQCDLCNEWYHGDCVGVREKQKLDYFHCDSCKEKSVKDTSAQSANSQALGK
jgi:PHD-finger